MEKRISGSGFMRLVLHLDLLTHPEGKLPGYPFKLSLPLEARGRPFLNEALAAMGLLHWMMGPEPDWSQLMGKEFEFTNRHQHVPSNHAHSDVTLNVPWDIRPVGQQPKDL